jgi:enoyl-CoA hydratase
MPDPRIRVERPAEGVERIVLARPERRNAQDRRLLYELDAAFARASADPAVKVIVLAADGPDFSSGHDLAEETPMSEVEARGVHGDFDAGGAEGWFAVESEIYRELCLRWRELPKPTIAAVQGRVIAGGLMLIWPCDLIVASEDASFSDPVLAFGVGGHEYFTHAWELGARRAKEMLFTGVPIGAAEALRLGMVNRVVPLERLAEETLELACQIARKPSFALMLAKRAVNHSLDLQGQRLAIDAAFAMHHLAHSHNMQLHGQLIDPSGIEEIRRDARGKRGTPS